MSVPASTEVRPAEKPLSGTVRVPGDKSISHRMALVAAVASGRSTLMGFSGAGDCAATLHLIDALGARVEGREPHIQVEGAGWEGLDQPAAPIDCGRSGTTMRLAAGILAGSRLDVTLTADSQLLRRPMGRVAEPLRLMGASVETTDGRPPLRVRGAELHGIEFEPSVASAQVKSAILLAGLRASGTTTVIEPIPTRDHTERLLAWLGLPVESGIAHVTLREGQPRAFYATIPGDMSSAAPLLASAAIVPGSAVRVEGVGVNPTRTGFLAVLARMGAEVQVEETSDGGPEPSGDVTVRNAGLQGIDIRRGEVAGVIDELPLIGILGAFAEGITVVRGAEELRVKESDRIAGLVSGLRALGAEAEELPDGFTVSGPSGLRAGAVDARGDHRLAMAFAVAALAAAGSVSIEGLGRVADSFPGFLETLGSLR